MLAYVAPFLLLVGLRLTLQGQQALRRQLFVPVLMLLTLYAGFRFEVGCDWTGYLNQWQVQEMTGVAALWARPELLWWGLIALLQYLELSYPWLNVAAAAIFFYGAWQLGRQQPDPLGFLVLLFPVLVINMPMSGIRQGAAIGVLCLAWIAFTDRRLLRFVAFVLLAAALHRSAMIMLLLAPLVTGNYSHRRLALCVLLALPGAFFLMSGEAGDVALSRYVTRDIDAAGAAFRTGVLLLSGLLFLVVLRPLWGRQFPQDYKVAMVGALMMCATMALLLVSSVIADRVAYYLVPIQAIIFARMPYLRHLPNRQFYAAAPYAGLLLLLLVWTAKSSLFQQCYVPYQSWLFGFPYSATIFY